MSKAAHVILSGAAHVILSGAAHVILSGAKDLKRGRQPSAALALPTYFGGKDLGRLKILPPRSARCQDDMNGDLIYDNVYS